MRNKEDVIKEARQPKTADINTIGSQEIAPSMSNSPHSVLMSKIKSKLNLRQFFLQIMHPTVTMLIPVNAVNNKKMNSR
jgi:hypothetical protein